MGAPTNTTLGVCHWSHPRASRGRGAAGRPHCGPLGVGYLASLFPLQLPNPMSSKRGGTEGKRLAKAGRQKIEERTCGFTFLSFGRERPHTHIQTHTKTRLGASPLSTDTRRRVQNGNSASPTAAPTVALQVCLWRAGNARCPSPWSKPSSTVTHLPRSIRTVRGLAAASRSQCRAALGRQGPGRGRAARDGVCVVCARVVMALRRGATVRGSVRVAHTLVS